MELLRSAHSKALHFYLEHVFKYYQTFFLLINILLFFIHYFSCFIRKDTKNGRPVLGLGLCTIFSSACTIRHLSHPDLIQLKRRKDREETKRKESKRTRGREVPSTTSYVST